jgi:hypothetical protein
VSRAIDEDRDAKYRQWVRAVFLADAATLDRIAADPAIAELKAKGATIFPNGIKAAAAEAVKRINTELGIKE